MFECGAALTAPLPGADPRGNFEKRLSHFWDKWDSGTNETEKGFSEPHLTLKVRASQKWDVGQMGGLGLLSVLT